MKPLIIVGSGGFAGVVIDAVRKSESHRVIGLIDDFLPVGQHEHGIPVLGGVSVMEKWSVEDVFIAIGNCEDRFNVWKRLNDYCPRLVSIAHTSAVIADTAKISTGCFISAGAYVGNECRIGMMTIINTNATLDHNSVVGEFSHLAPNSNVGSHCTIGNLCTIGAGATVASRAYIHNSQSVPMRGVVEK